MFQPSCLGVWPLSCHFWLDIWLVEWLVWRKLGTLVSKSENLSLQRLLTSDRSYCSQIWRLWWWCWYLSFCGFHSHCIPTRSLVWEKGHWTLSPRCTVTIWVDRKHVITGEDIFGRFIKSNLFQPVQTSSSLMRRIPHSLAETIQIFGGEFGYRSSWNVFLRPSWEGELKSLPGISWETRKIPITWVSEASVEQNLS